MKSSDLLFNVLSLFDFRIKIFSSKHRSHDLPPALCLEEKIFILKSNKDKTLNKRSELFTKCRHRKRFNAQNFKLLLLLLYIYILYILKLIATILNLT